jgi:hypothetical protein
MIEGQTTKVFISYSWDDDSHKQWVCDFATRLRGDGIDVILDRWDAIPGEDLPVFMERAVRESDFVLCICTPRYKEKSDQRGGGVGYEGNIMTAEAFVSRNQRKFIPVLRGREWKESAPSWLFGKYYIDLGGDPYSGQSYSDLLLTLRGEREEAPPIGENGQNEPVGIEENFEFVNREIELATLAPAKLHTSYWQCALVSAPTGYGKSRLLKRLISIIQNDAELNRQWNFRYIDLRNCDDLDNVLAYLAKEITGDAVTSDIDELGLKNKICRYVHQKMSIHSGNGGMRNILLVVDSIDYLSSTTIQCVSSMIHDVVVGSYIDYEQGTVPFHVRIILSGVYTELFWGNYLAWEIASTEKYRLLPPKKLPLSAFDDLAVHDLISRRTRNEGISLGTTVISDISYELQYLSGGHPQVVSEILSELVDRNFLQYKRYLRDNRERLVGNYVSKVAKKILHRFPLPQAQKDIKTVCVFRLIDLNTLRRLLSENLVSSQVDISLLGSLCENKILNPPNGGKLFYHDDIIRRILYLDLAFGNAKDHEHVQKTHKCAKSLYREWIEVSREQHSFHYFFVEWLFHALQITGLTDEVIFSEWKDMLALLQTTSLPLCDLKRAIREKIETDGEVKYLCRERFGAEGFSQLF